MSQKKSFRIRKTSDYGNDRSPIDTGFGFVFSDDIRDWQHSKRLKANLHMREVYAKLKKS